MKLTVTKENEVYHDLWTEGVWWKKVWNLVAADEVSNP